MDPSPLGPPDTGRPTPGYAALDRDYVPPPPEPDARRHPIVRHIVLFVLTFVVTTLVGVEHYYGFQSDFATAPPPQLGVDRLPQRSLVQHGHPRHPGRPRVRPLPGLRATTAWTRRCPTSSRRRCSRARWARSSGSASPSPTSASSSTSASRDPSRGSWWPFRCSSLGIALSQRGPDSGRATGGLELGEPLLLKAVAYAFWGTIPDGFTLNIHPTAFAALVRLPGHGAESVSDRPAGRRPHLLRRAGPPQHARHLRHHRCAWPGCRSCRRPGSCGPC